jgi:transcriptional regulator with XRE-family HTH domain
MPQAARSDGPWGDAIRYWLNQRKMRQADLAELTGVRANTISRVTRGFPTTTRVLAKIAVAFRVPIDVVLVSPELKLANEKRRRLALEISERVLRELERPSLRPERKKLKKGHAAASR